MWPRELPGQQRGHAASSLRTRDTPFGQDGYCVNDGYDFARTSFHILTVDGILGRDTLE